MGLIPTKILKFSRPKYMHAWQEVGLNFSLTLLVEGEFHHLIQEGVVPLTKDALLQSFLNPGGVLPLTSNTRGKRCFC